MANINSGPIEVVGAVSPETAGMINTGITGLSSLASSIFGQKPSANVQQSSGMPDWLLPAGLGLAGITAIVLITKKKK